MDLPDPVSGNEFRLELDKILKSNRKYYIQESCATNGMGLYEGLEWLNQKLNN